MVRKKLLVLANSIRNQGRCMAGREVVAEGGRYRLGGWVRPISGHGRGELDEEETLCSDGSMVHVMDVAEVALAAPAADAVQPENWLICGAKCWTKLDAKKHRLDRGMMIETPAGLWLDGEDREGRTERVSVAALRRLGAAIPEGHPPVGTPAALGSLYVVVARELRLEFRMEFNERKGFEERKQRAIFVYNGVKYELPLTDRVAVAKHCRRFPSSANMPAKVVSLGVRPVCVSLTPEYYGFHYKIVATVIE